MYQWSLDTLHLAQDSLRKHWTPPRSARTSLARRWVARVWSSYNHGGDHGDMTGGWFMIVLTKHIRGYNHQEWNHGDIIGISWGYVANNADMIETWRKKMGGCGPPWIPQWMGLSLATGGHHPFWGITVVAQIQAEKVTKKIDKLHPKCYDGNLFLVWLLGISCI